MCGKITTMSNILYFEADIKGRWNILKPPIRNYEHQHTGFHEESRIWVANLGWKCPKSSIITGNSLQKMTQSNGSYPVNGGRDPPGWWFPEKTPKKPSGND